MDLHVPAQLGPQTQLDGTELPREESQPLSGPSEFMSPALTCADSALTDDVALRPAGKSNDETH